MGRVSRLWDFIYHSGKEEAFWSTVGLIWAKLGGATLLAGITGYLTLGQLAGWQIFTLIVLMALAGVWIVNGIAFYLYPYWQAKNESETLRVEIARQLDQKLREAGIQPAPEIMDAIRIDVPGLHGQIRVIGTRAELKEPLTKIQSAFPNAMYTSIARLRKGDPWPRGFLD
jgi:hypothetical protein